MDISSLISAESGLSAGAYDPGRIHGAITLRKAEHGEGYTGIGKDFSDLENMLVPADDEGIFGSSMSDPARAMVTEETHDIPAVICCFENAVDPEALVRTKMDKIVDVNGIKYEIIKLLGHGKGGYSYLAMSCGKKVVLKQIHHEPCEYYTFGNKIESEENDYRRLKEAGIRIPVMISVDEVNERIIKEYIEGPTIYEMLRDGISVESFFIQVREMAELAKKAGLNIDYFPTNFVVCDSLIYYVDYECNQYMDEWDFENWGIKYWSRTPEFEEYLKNHK